MAWIESHQALGRHPKVFRLASKLRVHRAQAIGHLQYLWWWALDFAPTGNLSAFTPAEISAGAEWPGEPGPFHGALSECGWIDQDGMLHDWGDYAGRLLDKRETDRNRKREARKSNGCPTDVQRTAQVHNTPTQPTIPHPPPEADVGATSSKESADAAAFSSASTFARNWISANCPSFLRSGVSPFTRLIQRLGKAEAAKQVEQAMAKPDVGNPFSWLEAKLDKQSASKSANETSRPRRLTKPITYGDQ